MFHVIWSAPFFVSHTFLYILANFAVNKDKMEFYGVFT